MLFVPCPRCGAVVELFLNMSDLDGDSPRNVTTCDECDLAFAYDDVEVQGEAEPQIVE